MFKLGIVTVNGLARPRTMFGKVCHASFLLLEQLARDRQDASAYDRLVGLVRLPNGTYRWTAAGRLKQVDTAVLSALAARYPKGSRISVTDIGVSTGVTSTDLYEALSKLYLVDFLAGDLYRDIFAVSRGRRLAVILSRAGEPLQYVCGSFVLPGQLSESWAYPVNRLLKWGLRLALLPRAALALERAPGCETAPYFQRVTIGPFEICRLPFMSHQCFQLAESDPHFRFDILDVFQLPQRRTSVVRAMNVVTLDNFHPDLTRLAVRNCLRMVEPGGMLVMGRSRSLRADDVRATIYRVEPACARVVKRLNGGCELESIVLQEGTQSIPGVEGRTTS